MFQTFWELQTFQSFRQTTFHTTKQVCSLQGQNNDIFEGNVATLPFYWSSSATCSVSSKHTSSSSHPFAIHHFPTSWGRNLGFSACPTSSTHLPVQLDTAGDQGHACWSHVHELLSQGLHTQEGLLVLQSWGGKWTPNRMSNLKT